MPGRVSGVRPDAPRELYDFDRQWFNSLTLTNDGMKSSREGELQLFTLSYHLSVTQSSERRVYNLLLLLDSLPVTTAPRSTRLLDQPDYTRDSILMTGLLESKSDVVTDLQFYTDFCVCDRAHGSSGRQSTPTSSITVHGILQSRG